MLVLKEESKLDVCFVKQEALSIPSCMIVQRLASLIKAIENSVGLMSQSGGSEESLENDKVAQLGCCMK